MKLGVGRRHELRGILVHKSQSIGSRLSPIFVAMEIYDDLVLLSRIKQSSRISLKSIQSANAVAIVPLRVPASMAHNLEEVHT